MFRLNSKGQTGVWEGIIILILIILLGGSVYLLLSRKTDTQIFKAGSQSISPPITAHFGGCAVVKEYVYANPDNKISH